MQSVHSTVMAADVSSTAIQPYTQGTSRRIANYYDLCVYSSYSYSIVYGPWPAHGGFMLIGRRSLVLDPPVYIALEIKVVPWIRGVLSTTTRT